MNKAYYLCSADLVKVIKPTEVSKPFKSGYDFDKDDAYYVAVLNFEAVEAYYKTNVAPFEEEEISLEETYERLDADEALPEHSIDFWCRECVPGQMSVKAFTLKGCKANGLFYEIQDKLNLTAERNIAMTIYQLAERFNCTPIEFINKIA